MQPSPKKKQYATYRPDIDGLRAIAVIVVIAYHFFPSYVTSGFLGVDVFFVISGYVITLHLRNSAEKTWSEYLLDFYVRRLKRVTPALIFCIITCSILFALFTVEPDSDIFSTASTALLGFSNIYLMFISSDYFSLEAELNPFTHTWSLGVEEQFYLLLPCILGITGFCRVIKNSGKRNAILVLTILSAISLALFLILFEKEKAFTFYSLFTRFWELSIGVGAAILNINILKLNISKTALKILNVVVFLCLTACFFAPMYLQAYVTLATVFLSASLIILLSCQSGLLYRFLTNKVVVAIGLLSYSLYLWHWPILVLAKYTVGVTYITIPILLFIIVILSSVSYFFVERPLRYKKYFKSKNVVLTRFICVCLITSIIIPFLQLFSIINIFNIPSPSGIYVKCNGKETLKQYSEPLTSCLNADRSEEKPNILYVLGDSHARHLMFMVEEVALNSRFQARFINPDDSKEFPFVFFHNENASSATMDYILQNGKRGDVLIIALHRGHFNDGKIHSHIDLNKKIHTNTSSKNFLNNMQRYIPQFQSKEIKIILVKDTPLMKSVMTAPSCYLQIKLTGTSGCEITKEQDLHTRTRQDRSFDSLANKYNNVFIWDPLPYIYNGKETFDVIDGSGNYLMIDWNHISSYQSKLLAPHFKLHLKNIDKDIDK